MKKFIQLLTILLILLFPITSLLAYVNKEKTFGHNPPPLILTYNSQNIPYKLGRYVWNNSENQENTNEAYFSPTYILEHTPSFVLSGDSIDFVLQDFERYHTSLTCKFITPLEGITLKNYNYTPVEIKNSSIIAPKATGIYVLEIILNIDENHSATYVFKIEVK